MLRTLQGYGDVNLTEKDSLLYTSGENLYITGKYERAAEIFRSYLNRISFRKLPAECAVLPGRMLQEVREK